MLKFVGVDINVYKINKTKTKTSFLLPIFVYSYH